MGTPSWIRPAAGAPAAKPAPIPPKAPAPPAATPPSAPQVPAAPGGLTIVRLSAENVKRLKAVEIAPDGNLVVLSGRNGQGKTSVLDAITYALGGKGAVCAEPVRRGQESAEIVCDLGDLVVKRRFTVGGGTTLEVTSRDGLRFPSPQAMLDKLVGELTFDPLAFARQDGKAQLETLRKLLGLNFSEADRESELAYNERTHVNRELKAAEARLKAMPPMHAGTPKEPVNPGDLAGEMQRANLHNSENARARHQVEKGREDLQRRQADIAKMRDALARAEAELQELTAVQADREAKVSTLADIDTAPIFHRMKDADAVNQRVRANQQRAEAEKEVAAKRAKSDELTSRLDEIQQWKANEVANAKMPVTGLGLSEDGVTLNGLPLDQASAAEQLRVSVAIGIAMNPRLRVLLLRDASLLDRDSLALLADMAKAAGAQVWLERVEDDSATAVVIEDGMVKEAAGAQA
jgi:hypothetical protein